MNCRTGPLSVRRPSCRPSACGVEGSSAVRACGRARPARSNRRSSRRASRMRATTNTAASSSRSPSIWETSPAARATAPPRRSRGLPGPSGPTALREPSYVSAHFGTRRKFPFTLNAKALLSVSKCYLFIQLSDTARCAG